MSFVAGISRNQRKVLAARGVTTVASLGELTLPVKPKIQGMGGPALVRIHEQARLQVKGREDGRLVYELLGNVETEKGFGALPVPGTGDVFLDFEGHPYVTDQGLEHLTGILELAADGGSEPTYRSWKAFNRVQEKTAFESFMEYVTERWREYPAMHIYHYAAYEPTAIKKLAGRHGTCIDEVDELLRAGVFVDLYRVLRQSLRASVESYSIKRLEPLYGFTRAVPLREANMALSAFEAALVLANSPGEMDDLVKTIEGYNRDDCVSALRLRDWLEIRRTEQEAQTGLPLARPAPRPAEPGLDLAAQLDEVGDLKALLTSGLPPDEVTWTGEQRAGWLLAQMLEWHRREEKSAWWEYFRLCDLSDDELLEDKSALGGLVYLGQAGKIKRSVVHRYGFPPQDHAIGRALEVHDPRTQNGAGDLFALDERTALSILSEARHLAYHTQLRSYPMTS